MDEAPSSWKDYRKSGDLTGIHPGEVGSVEISQEEIDADDIADDAEEERFDGEEFEQAEESVDVEVGALRGGRC